MLPGPYPRYVPDCTVVLNMDVFYLLTVLVYFTLCTGTVQYRLILETLTFTLYSLLVVTKFTLSKSCILH